MLTTDDRSLVELDSNMILFGYILIFLYIFLLIFILGRFLKEKFNVETSRKIIHIMLFGVWVLIDIFLKDTVHQIVIPLVFLVLNSLSYKFNIYKSIERTDDNHLGTVYFAIVISIVMGLSYFFPHFYYHSGIAIACLTFGDGFAALVGYNINSTKIHNNKSIAGFIACIVSTICILLIYKKIYYPQLTIVTVLVLAILSALLEMVDYGLDNFSITFGTFVVSFLLEFLPGHTFVISITIALIVFNIVFFAKAIHYYGALLSAAIVFIFAYYGGLIGTVFLLTAYFSIFLISKVKKVIIKKDNNRVEQPRGFMQILINGGFGSLFMVIYDITGSTSMLIVSLISIGGCFIDSVSSDLGVLSSQKPYDLIKRKYVARGLSGGVTILGTLSALCFSVVLALFISIHTDFSYIKLVMICSVIFSQTVIDSILGSLFQEKYICSKCKEITEQELHCEIKTIHYSGIPHINNNTVNFLSSLIVTFIASIIFCT